MSELILHMLISIVLLIQLATEKSDANVQSCMILRHFLADWGGLI